MKILMGSTLVLGILLAFPTFSPAQSSDVPMKDGHPDLSGVWSMKRMPGQNYLGWTYTKEDPPMTPWAVERFNKTKPSFGPRMFEDSNDPVNPTTVNAAGCFPPGIPRIYLHPFPMEIIQQQGRVLQLFEFDHFIRQIWTDGRGHDEAEGPTWMGDSIGKWDGDTLVVDSNNFNDHTWIDRAGHPHSDKLHVVERIRRLDKNTLQDEVTIEDPVAYTHPWGGTMTFALHPDWHIMEMICEDNVNFEQFIKGEEKPKEGEAQPKQ